jgi:subtilisin family serine protease
MAQDERAPDQRTIGRDLQRSRISHDLLVEIESPASSVREGPGFPVIIELNNDYPGGAKAARAQVLADYFWAYPEAPDRLFWTVARGRDPFSPTLELLASVNLDAFRRGARPEPTRVKFAEADQLDIRKSAFTDSYLFGRLTPETIVNLAFEDRGEGLTDRRTRLVFKLWLDAECRGMIDASVRTVKCDAAQAAFGAKGKDIVWAVADTGIDGSHPHFLTHQTLDLPTGLYHCDLTTTNVEMTVEDSSLLALIDNDGHGSHVAGIIAGEVALGGSGNPTQDIIVCKKERRENAEDLEYIERPERIGGLAPLAKLVSLKVLTARDKGSVSSALAAVGYVQRVNEFGRNLRIHGLNLSLGYSFDPKIYGAGQSPLCRDVDRLVKSGVVVVVAAGNGGYGRVTLNTGASVVAAHGATIADPGNAELAITVGSTHRDRPHEYGVSYFSAKGPTADGRLKPDLVAPGERIVSCALAPAGTTSSTAHYCEESGTSMAAPHVSAAIAAFLSSRAEFVGKPERVKDLFLRTATSLGRQPEFQGAGLVDVMRALQAV